MPKWTPGTQNGKRVNVKYTIPISFHLDEPSIEYSDTEKAAYKAGYEQAKKDVEEGRTTFIVDGKELSYEEVKALDPKVIKSMDVLKQQSGEVNKIVIITK